MNVADALNESYTELAALAASICRRWGVQEPQDIEDATQDAFLNALRFADTYRAEAKLTTWFGKIVINVVRMRRRQHVELEELTELAAETPIETHEEVEKLLAVLPQAEAAILREHYLEGKSWHEVAQARGWTTREAKKHGNWNLEKLRRYTLQVRRHVDVAERGV